MTATADTRYPVDTLWVDTVHTTPADADWSEGWGETWEFYTAPECPGCGDYAAYRDYRWECKNEECENHGREIENEDDGPMMNYFYPLPDLNRLGSDPYRAAEAISDLPLCIIERDGSYGLALTGGGMDLSWEIAEAYTRLGYLPPLHFCDLPRMAGYPRTEAHRYVIAACLRSCDVAENRAQRTRENLARIDNP